MNFVEKNINNINKLNFLSATLISPAIKLGNISENSELIIEQIKQNSEKTNLIVFPELCLTGVTCFDYFFCDDLINQINSAINRIINATFDFNSTVIIGTPFQINNKLINCALFISCGKLLGIIPKQTKNRWFTVPTVSKIIFNNCEKNNNYKLKIDNYEVKIADNLIFESFCKLGICVGEMNFETLCKLNEAEIIINLEAKPYFFNSCETKKNELINLSKLSKTAIAYVNSNPNESTADNVFGGFIGILECGKQIYNSELENENNFENCNKNKNYLSFETQIYCAEIDLDIIRGHRKNNFSQTKLNFEEKIETVGKKLEIETVEFEFPTKNLENIHRFCSYKLKINEKIEEIKVKSFYEDPFFTYSIAKSSDSLEILEIQAISLAKRLKNTKLKSVVLGISGGIDSTLALLVCEKCFSILNYDKKNIHAISMPGLATSLETNEISAELAKKIGVTYKKISINDAVKLNFQMLEHAENNQNIVYENTQARQRTMFLFNYANKIGGIVVGTGDMSEIALGWSTFGGDHISNYNVNAGIPKTVAKSILEFFAYSEAGKMFSENFANVIKKVLSKPISPELLPPKFTNSDGKSSEKPQNTEEILGPYELHDFFLYYFLKYFLSKSKIHFLAKYTFSEKYSDAEISKYLDIFFERFRLNQYKRNCSPDGVSIYEISLSPRVGAFFPSDLSE